MEFYDQAINTWIHCKMIKVNKNSFKVSIKDNSNETMLFPINTLKLRECICLKCLITKYEKKNYGY